MSLLSWPAVDPARRTVIGRLMGGPVFKSRNDTTPCDDWLTINIPQERSGTNLWVRKAGSAANLPPGLRNSTVGGVMITVKPTPRPEAGTWIDDVRFEGRVLYPNGATANIYDTYSQPEYRRR